MATALWGYPSGIGGLLGNIGVFAQDGKRMSYPGGKGNGYQHYINLIPPHRAFVSLFAGDCAVFRHKRLAELNWVVDMDRDVCQTWQQRFYNHSSELPIASDGMPWKVQMEQYHGCALDFIWKQLSLLNQKDTLVYCDPPYLFSTRAGDRDIYDHEFGTEEEHERLLGKLLNLQGMVMVCGYESELYNDLLSGWECYQYQAYTRSHRPVTECVWMNYKPPNRLHDYRYLGDNFRERERIKRKAKRWVDGLLRLPALERRAILAKMEAEGVI